MVDPGCALDPKLSASPQVSFKKSQKMFCPWPRALSSPFDGSRCVPGQSKLSRRGALNIVCFSGSQENQNQADNWKQKQNLERKLICAEFDKAQKEGV